MLEGNEIIIPEEIKNFFRQNESKIYDKFDLDNFDANGGTIRVLFDFLRSPRMNGYPSPKKFVSLKTMLEFSQNIVTNCGKCLDGKIVENMFYVLIGLLWASEGNNLNIDKTIFLESLELVKSVVKLKIKFSYGGVLLGVDSFMKEVVRNASFQFDINLIFDAINNICDSYTNNKQDLIASNLACLLDLLNGLRKYGLDIQKSLILIQKIWNEFNGDLDCHVIAYMFYLLENSLKCQDDKSIKKKDIETIFELLEKVLKSTIKLDYDALVKMRDVTELLLETIAKDYFQDFDVKQIFIMLWDVCINTIDDCNDDAEVILHRVNLVLFPLKIFINALNKYHRAENTDVAAKLVEYIWSQAKNVLDDEAATVRHQNIVEMMLFLLAKILKYKDIANFANENLKDILSLAVRVLALNFWLEQDTFSIIDNDLTVQRALEVLLKLSQMGKEQSKQINDKIEKFGLKIEDDTIVIADKNMFDGFYGDKSECISKTINNANTEYKDEKIEQENEIAKQIIIIENKTGNPKLEIAQKDVNKRQSNDLKKEDPKDKNKYEKEDNKENKETIIIGGKEEKEKTKDTKKVIKANTQNKGICNKIAYTNEQILEEVESAYCQNREIDGNISRQDLLAAIKSNKRYYYYAVMLSSKKYEEIREGLSLGQRIVIFFYRLPFKWFYAPQKNNTYKQSGLNKNMNQISPRSRDITKKHSIMATTQNETNNQKRDNYLK